MEIISKELLSILEDVSKRLPYGVLIKTPSGIGHLNGINASIFGWTLKVSVDSVNVSTHNLENCKPVLRKRFSMTRQETLIYQNYCRRVRLPRYRDVVSSVEYSHEDTPKSIQYLYSIFIDVDGLIDRDLAVEDTDNLYNITDE